MCIVTRTPHSTSKPRLVTTSHELNLDVEKGYKLPGWQHVLNSDDRRQTHPSNVQTQPPNVAAAQKGSEVNMVNDDGPREVNRCSLGRIWGRHVWTHRLVWRP